MAKRGKSKAQETEVAAAEELGEDELLEVEDDPESLDEPDSLVDPVEEIFDENAEKSKDELYALATQYRIKGRSKMTQAELAAAVSEAEAQGVEPVLDGVDADEEETLPGAKLVTAEQAQLVQQASLDQLEGVVQDPKLEPQLRAYIEGEIAARRAEVETTAKKVGMTGPLTRFRVTKGGMYVPPGGSPTTLPVGSMVMTTTHDLAQVRKQGIEFEPCEAPKVLHDQLGRQYTSFE